MYCISQKKTVDQGSCAHVPLRQRFFFKHAKFLACAGLVVATSAQANVPPSERDVLDAIFSGTGGQSWTQKNGWGTGFVSECTFYGITCTVDQGGQEHVKGIVLPNNGLIGQLPPFLIGLPYLQALEVSNNQLSGPIPLLTGMTNLTMVDVRNNQFTGAIPSLAGLTSLTTFLADSNQLT